MGKSYRTQKPAAAANRVVDREDDGAFVLPRIITRKPRPGDRHPLSATALRGILRRDVPVEYLNGLSRIELRSRPTKVVGDPFGCYLPDEKAIVLYSLPMTWSWHSFPSEAMLNSMRRFFAEVTEGSVTHVSWPAPEVLGVWFYIEVFAHELGHHYRNQYRIRRGSRRHRRHEEFVADLHSTRFYRAFVARLRAKRRSKASAA